VAEMNAAEPLVNVPQTATTDANSHTNNCLNAEVVDARHVTIYQYYPGGHITVWRLTKHGGVKRGDANGDGNVDINDVTVLIGFILSGEGEGINHDNADCDLVPGIDINDVTALIGYILTGAWSDE